jgi:hypothetical protein
MELDDDEGKHGECLREEGRAAVDFSSRHNRYREPSSPLKFLKWCLEHLLDLKSHRKQLWSRAPSLGDRARYEPYARPAGW